MQINSNAVTFYIWCKNPSWDVNTFPEVLTVLEKT